MVLFALIRTLESLLLEKLKSDTRTESRTRVAGFKVLSANHYTIRATVISLVSWVGLNVLIKMLLNKYVRFLSISKDDYAEELLFKIEQNYGIKKQLEDKAFQIFYQIV